MQRVTAAQTPILYRLSTLLLTAIVVAPLVAALRRGERDTDVRWSAIAACSTLVAVSGWALLTTSYQHDGVLDANQGIVVAALREAGLSPGTHAVIGALLAVMVFGLLRPLGTATASSTAELSA